MNQKAAPAVVACPRCGKPVEWAPENRYRPFCSERCRKIDLGAWAAGEYRVPGTEEPKQPGAAPGSDQDD